MASACRIDPKKGQRGRGEHMNAKRTITAMAAGLMLLSTGTASMAGDIVWARDGDIDTLDPQRATSTLSRQVWYQLYDSLLEFNEQGEVVPISRGNGPSALTVRK